MVRNAAKRQGCAAWVAKPCVTGCTATTPKLGGTAAQQGEFASWVEAGPDLKKDGIVRWRRQDLQQRVAACFGVHLHERTIGKMLTWLGFSHVSVRPQHPKADAQAQQVHKKRMARPVGKRFPRSGRCNLRPTYPACRLSPGQDGDPRAPSGASDEPTLKANGEVAFGTDAGGCR
jgi:hypothetical protein